MLTGLVRGHPEMPKSVLKDLIGQRFGRLTVITRAPSTSYGATRWVVRCDDPCGKETTVFATALSFGRTKSCGRHLETHGQSGGRNGKPSSGAYQSWSGMFTRCTDPTHEKYANYGGRGIAICERWHSFDNFYADLGDRPPGMSLERNDVNGNYEPANCRWATSREQSRNKRSTVVTLDGVREIVDRYIQGETQVSIASRFGIKAGYVGKIIHGSVWPEVDRPYRENWARPTSDLVNPLALAAREHAILVAKRDAGSTYQHIAQDPDPDLDGHRFGLLVVLGRASYATNGEARWTVRCNCSNATEKVVLSKSLALGKTTSCGCMITRLTHGQSGGRNGRPSGAYVSWSRMIQRCTYKKCPGYPRYGGRGISVCERWMRFENFYEDMGDRPPGMSIEREDVNGNYELANCRWASSRDQARNTRASVVTFDGVQEILGRFEHGETKASIGRRLGIDPTYVSMIIRGKSWAEIERPYLKKEKS